jgi:ribosomal protein S18 acetylase RimI-like enzyme
VDVRLLQGQDKASLVLILEKYHYEHQTMEDGGGTGEPFDQDDYTEWFANDDPDKVGIVAKAGDTVVGFLLLQTDDGMPELVGQHWAITDFYVDAAYRKHGVGRKLIQYASSHCIDDGRYKCSRGQFGLVQHPCFQLLRFPWIHDCFDGL